MCGKLLFPEISFLLPTRIALFSPLVLPSPDHSLDSTTEDVVPPHARRECAKNALKGKDRSLILLSIEGFVQMAVLML